MPKIAKTRWYLAKITDNRHRLVMPSLGSFATDSKAFDSMFRDATIQHDPRFREQERKPEFVGFTTVKGERVLRYPNIYMVEEA